MGGSLDTDDFVKIATVGIGGFVADEAFLAPGRRQARFAKDEARAAKEARDTAAAQDQAERNLAIRQQARQERVRRAQIIAAGEASGLGESSAVSGTLAQNTQIRAADSAFAQGASITASRLTELNQEIASAQQRSLEAQSQGQFYKNVFDLGTKVAMAIPTGGASLAASGVPSGQPTAPFTGGGGRGL